jgi:hypothetical protein
VRCGRDCPGSVGEMVRYCECGLPLVQKPRESATAFASRAYCPPEHRYRYFRPAPAAKNFGTERTKPEGRARTGEGLMRYLYGKPLVRA